MIFARDLFWLTIRSGKSPTLARFKFHINITFEFGFKCNSCGGSLAISNSLRNATEYYTACPLSTGVFVL